MRLELDLGPDDWADYAKAPTGGLKRVGVLIPKEPVGIAAFVRLGVDVDGTPAVVLTPWLIWKAAHQALAQRFGEAPPEPEPAPELAVLGDVADAMAEHARRWGLGPEHLDGTDHEGWTQLSGESHQDATAAAMIGELTWAHTFLEAAHAALAIEDPAELRKALARVAGTAGAWMTAIDGRTS